MALALRDGGYDDGYSACPCFWGTRPGTLVRQIADRLSDFRGLRVLDAGCGEGKNAVFLSELGATVLATDVSVRAIANARAAWGPTPGIEWRVASVEEL